MTQDIWKKKLLASTLFAGVAGAVWAAPALAQDADEEPEIIGNTVAEDEDAVQERVVVTGSRLRRASDATIPVTGISEDQIELRQFTNPIEALEEIPFVGAGVNIQGENDQYGANQANPDILNLQTNRTLTLINGRRFVSSNQATVFVPGNANGAQVDLTLINPSLIERTEILAGSQGSATYGADAVGGVVNIILKDDYEGLEASGRYGITEIGDGENYRFNVLAGKNFLDDRANITIAAEYFDTEAIRDNDPERFGGRQVVSTPNPLNTGAGDGISNSVLVPWSTNPYYAYGGTLTTGFRIGGSSNTPFYPNSPNAAFTAAGLGTPFEYGQTAAGQAVDPLLFVGTFAPAGTFLTVPNTDPATSAFLPNRAVPLAFGPNGELLADYNLGDLQPPTATRQYAVPNGDGLPAGIYDNLQSGQERISLNALTRFDITNNITYKAEYFYGDISDVSFEGPDSNGIGGSTSAGTFGVPIYLDQNPYVTAGTIQTINDLEAQGAVIPTNGGERVLYLSRSLLDVTGIEKSGADQEFFRTAQAIEGEFEYFNRAFNWDVSASYGRVEQQNYDEEVLDIEFALATDVVDDGSGNIVCRQQVTGPEAIDIRNPGLANINNAQGKVPTQAQIDACQPLNLLGFGAPSQAAIDYVTAPSTSENISEQLYFAAQFGGEVIELPAGPLLFSVQGEYREESNEFNPGEVFARGLGRATTGQPSSGEAEYTEYGIEGSLPIFGGDFTFPLLNELTIEGAYRVVERSGQGGPLNASSSSEDDVWSYGGRYSPIEDITFRGSISKAVRSPSIVELFGAGVTGFAGIGRGTLNPCDSRNVDAGPNPSVRRANCLTLVNTLGLDPSILDDNVTPGGSAPAAGASNAGLENEESDSWTAGVVFEPRFIPGLTFTADYYNIDLEGAIGLTGIVFDCFDSADFPNVPVGGFNACEAFLYPVENASGQLVVPDVNPITGVPVAPIANPGAPAQDAGEPLNATFSFFPSLNFGTTELRSWNFTANYGFELEDLMGDMAANWGRLDLSGNMYYLERFDINGQPNVGEPGYAEIETVVSAGHTVGPLRHQLQWFRTSDVKTDATVSAAVLGDQTPDFANPEFNIFNYNLQYDINDNFQAQFVVNNLFDERLDPEGYLMGDVLGRRYQFGLRYQF